MDEVWGKESEIWDDPTPGRLAVAEEDTGAGGTKPVGGTGGGEVMGASRTRIDPLGAATGGVDVGGEVTLET